MNFKTILSVSALALFGSAIAAPTANAGDEVSEAQHECYMYGGKLFTSGDNSKYACIQRYWPDREFKLVSPNDSVCFIGNNVPYCVNSKFSNIEECDLKSDKYDFDGCMKNFLKGPIRLYLRLRDFETKEKFVLSPINDYNECIHNDGIYLMDNKANYVCLSSEYVSFPDDEHCVYVQEESEDSEKVRYCVQQENTNIENCNKTSDNYNYEKCMNKITSLSEGKIAKISKYPW